MPIELSNGISDENRSINKQNGNWLKENEAIFHTIIGGGAVKIGYQEEENRAYFRSDPKPEIVIGGKLVEDLSDSEKIFVAAHEAGHFIQYIKETETYNSIFEITKKKASKNLGSPKIWHSFYNIFLDLHDNAMIRERSFIFQNGEKNGETIHDLYSGNLFKKTDYTKEPESIQFMNSLLRETMVPEEKTVIDEKVRNILDEPVSYFGKKYANMGDLISGEVCNSNRTLKESLATWNRIVTPKLEELLKSELENKKNEGENESESKNEGENEGEGQESDKLSNKMGDATDENRFKDVKEYVNKKNETASDKQKRINKEKFSNFAKSAGLNDEDIKEASDRNDRITEMNDELKKVWWNFVQQDLIYVQGSSVGYKTGSRVNTDEVIKQYGVLINTPDEARIFERDTPTVEEKLLPPKMRTFLLLDCSGSMFPENIVLAKDVIVALGQSQASFQIEGKNQNPDFGMDMELVVVPYGDTAVSDFLDIDFGMTDMTKNLSDLLLKVSQLSNLGGTQCSEGLKVALEKIKTDNDNGIMNILVQVTDGETQTFEESKLILGEMKEIGVKMAGINIGTESYIFENLWEENGVQLKGLDSLQEAFIDVVKKMLIKK